MKRGKQLIVSLGVILVLAGLSWGQDSLNIARVGQLYDNEIWGGSHDVAVCGSHAYVVNNGLRVIDVSNPAEPVEIGHYNMTAAYGVTVVGSYAYLTGYGFNGSTFTIVDVSNPTQPVMAGQLEFTDDCQNVAVSGSYAYIAGPDLRVVDISNPAAPAVVGFCDLPGTTYDVAIAGHYAYVTGYGLRVVDIAAPANPVLVSSIDLPGHVHGVTISGTRAYVVSGYAGLYIFDVSNPAAPILLGLYPTDEQIWEARVSGSYAYIAHGWSGLVVLDVSNPANPTPIASCKTPGHSNGIDLIGTHCYVSDSDYGLWIINVSNPTAPVMQGWCYPPLTNDVKVSGSLAYVADGAVGLRIVNVSNPLQPVEIGRCHTFDAAVKVTLAGQYAYVAAMSDGLRIVDVSNPSSPFEVGHFDIDMWANARSVAVSGHYAYVAEWIDNIPPYGQLYVLDISDPSSPQLVGLYTMPEVAMDVAVSGSRVYVANSYGGLLIFDVSSPSSPTLLGCCPSHESAASLALSGSYAFVADEYYGLQVVDISNPSQPFEVWANETGSCTQVAVEGSLLYASEPYLKVYMISDPTAPALSGWYNEPYIHSWGGVVSHGYLYRAEGYHLSVYRFAPTTVCITMTPVNPPIVIPSQGGSFTFNASVSNGTSTTIAFDAWIMVRLPHQNWYGPVLGPLSFSLPGNSNLTRVRQQFVPGSAPTGEYCYEARVGDYPSVVWDTSGFDFFKAGGDREPESGEWTNTGEEFSSSEVLIPHNSSLIISVSPNPFNPTTAISYELRIANHVSLKVYDTAGRLVAILVDGIREAGPHEVTFDGSKLASGIYLARLEAGEFMAVQKLVLMK